MTDHEHVPSALRVAHLLGILRDVVVVLVGFGVLIATPPSMAEFGADDLAVLAWSLLPLVGGVMCLFGKVREHTLAEVVGSFTVASGFIVWTVAAVMAPGASLISWAVAGAFFVLALNKVIRGIIVATGVLRETP